MNTLETTITLIDGYDKHKTPRSITFRHFTLEDIKALDSSHGEFWFIANNGTAKRCRKSSALKTWKREPNRFECSFKYGMYENIRWDTEEMLTRLLIAV